MTELSDKLFYKYIIIIIIVIFLVMLCQSYVQKEHMINIDNSVKWNRNICNYNMNQTLTDELNNHNLIKSNDKWNLYFPCSYDNIYAEMNQMPIKDDAKYFILDNVDEFVAKDMLWKNIVSYYGIDIAKTMLPNSYNINDSNDMTRFTNEFDKDKIYIMKKNIQRQEGLKISRSKQELLNGDKNNFVIIQELLQNPYIISGRKTNMRFYVLVTCKFYGNSKTTNVYVHKDGFMYYTKVMFKKNSTDFDPNITTGYIDRKVYDENPLTHTDMIKYLDDENRTNLLEDESHIRLNNFKISDIYFYRIYNIIRTTFNAFIDKICKTEKFKNNTMFQLFGIDVAVDDKLFPLIMEINKGPDMGAKDKRDSELKHKVIRDVLNIIEVIKIKDENRFIKLI